MGIKIEIPSHLQPFTNNVEIVEVNGNTVGECLKRLVKQFPDISKMLFSKDGNLFEHVIISVNGENAYPEQLAKPVKDGDKLHVIFIAGGG